MLIHILHILAYPLSNAGSLKRRTRLSEDSAWCLGRLAHIYTYTVLVVNKGKK